MALAQKIMDKLLDLSTQLCTYDPDRLLAIDYSAASSVGGAMGRVASAGSSYYDAQSTTSGKARRRGSVMETDPGATLAEKLAGVGMEQNVTVSDSSHSASQHCLLCADSLVLFYHIFLVTGAG